MKKRKFVPARKVIFGDKIGFKVAIDAVFDNYFRDKKISKYGNWEMYLKATFILALLPVSYIGLLFSTHWLEALGWGLVLSQAFALTGFNIMHDGGHGSFSPYPLLNWWMAYVADLIGASSWLWKYKHNILHHTYTNIKELDNDIKDGLFRYSPEQPLRPWHRFQHLYALPAYCLLTIVWMHYGDFAKLKKGKIDDNQIPKMRRKELVAFWFGKAFYFFFMLYVPTWYHPFSHVLIVYVGIHLVLGFTLSIVFQLAHTVEGTAFPEPDPESDKLEDEWAIHEVKTSRNFACESLFACLYLGGLNFQIEHHLRTDVCHVHYPRLAGAVKTVCQEYGVTYFAYPTMRAAVGAHLRHLRAMGRGETLAT